MKREIARDLWEVSSPLDIYLSADQHTCVRTLLEAGREPPKRMVPEGHARPGVMFIYNGQSEKIHNSKGIRGTKKGLSSASGKIKLD